MVSPVAGRYSTSRCRPRGSATGYGRPSLVRPGPSRRAGRLRSATKCIRLSQEGQTRYSKCLLIFVHSDVQKRSVCYHCAGDPPVTTRGTMVARRNPVASAKHAIYASGVRAAKGASNGRGLPDTLRAGMAAVSILGTRCSSFRASDL